MAPRCRRSVAAASGYLPMITPAQVNERMLARRLGIGEDDAAVRLAQTFAITAPPGEATPFRPPSLPAQLERTITLSPAARPVATLRSLSIPRLPAYAAKQLFIGYQHRSASPSRGQPSPRAARGRPPRRPAHDRRLLRRIGRACPELAPRHRARIRRRPLYRPL